MKIIKLLILLLFPTILIAQDGHLSQYYLNPMSVNPAYAGQFNGCFRMNADYRNQWSSFMSSNSFKTITASADMQILKDRMGGNFFGAGITFNSDKGGDVAYGTQVIGFNFGYSHILNKKKPMTLSAAFNVTDWQKKIDFTKVKADDMTDPGIVNASTGVTFMDFGTGLLFYHQPIQTVSYTLGFSASHLNKPEQTFVNLSDKLGTKTQIHANAYIQASDAFALIPTVLRVTQNKASETYASFLAKVLLDESGESETSIYFGLGTRFTKPGVDATTAFFRFDFANLSLGLSYDFNVSGLKYASKSLGGPEFALQYIIKCPKSKSVVYNKRKKLYCPRF